MKNDEICLYEETSNPLFAFFVKIIQKECKGVLVEKLNNGLETKYYDFGINKYLFTLHQIPMIGITISPTYEESITGKEINFYTMLSSFLINRINDKI